MMSNSIRIDDIARHHDKLVAYWQTIENEIYLKQVGARPGGRYDMRLSDNNYWLRSSAFDVLFAVKTLLKQSYLKIKI